MSQWLPVQYRLFGGKRADQEEIKMDRGRSSPSSLINASSHMLHERAWAVRVTSYNRVYYWNCLIAFTINTCYK